MNTNTYFPQGEYCRYPSKAPVVKFLRNNSDKKTDSQIVQVLTNLMNTLNLSATFPTDATGFANEVKEKKYLIINDKALCFSTDRDASDDVPLEYRDLYFSDVILKEPVKCAQGHQLEKSRAEFWARTHQNLCPVKGDHSIGNLQIDADLSKRIQAFVIGYQEIKEGINNIEAKKNIQLFHQVKKEKEVEKHKEESKTEIQMGVGKIVLKVVVAHADEIIVKHGLKAVKLVPFVGIAFGLIACTYRLWHANNRMDYVKAAGELTSGALSVIPGAGYVSSLVLDGALACHDVNNMYASMKVENLPVNFKEACEIFKLPNDKKLLTKEMVDAAWKRVQIKTHSDKVKPSDGVENSESKEYTQYTNKAKEVIYKECGWSKGA